MNDYLYIDVYCIKINIYIFLKARSFVKYYYLQLFKIMLAHITLNDGELINSH